MSTRRSERSFGDEFGRLGARLNCLIQRDGELFHQLKKTITSLPRNFEVSGPLNWQEQPSSISDPCTLTTPSPGSQMTNFFTVIGTVLTRPASTCEPDSSPDTCPPDPCTTSSSRQRSRRSRNLRAASSVPTSSSPISPEDVNALYQKLNIKGGKREHKSSRSQPKPILKGGGGNRHCDESSYESNCDDVCVKGCVPCPRRVFPTFVPYALTLHFQFTQLRGTLQNCNPVLVHNFNPAFIAQIESSIRSQGVNVSGGLLRRLPPVATAAFTGYGNNGSPLSLQAILNFRQGTVTLGRASIPGATTTNTQLFGTASQPVSNQPRLTALSLGTRSQFLTNFFNIQIVIPLQHLTEFLNRSGGLGSGRRRSQGFAAANNDDLNTSFDY